MDTKARIFDFDLREKVDKLWDKKIPIVNHVVVEGAGIGSLELHSDRLVRKISSLCKKMSFNVVNRFIHEFKPQGVSVVFILRESHIAVHAWPEKNYIHLDVVTCSHGGLNALKLIDEVINIFKPQSSRAISFKY